MKTPRGGGCLLDGEGTAISGQNNDIIFKITYGVPEPHCEERLDIGQVQLTSVSTAKERA